MGRDEDGGGAQQLELFVGRKQGDHFAVEEHLRAAAAHFFLHNAGNSNKNDNLKGHCMSG